MHLCQMRSLNPLLRYLLAPLRGLLSLQSGIIAIWRDCETFRRRERVSLFITDRDSSRTGVSRHPVYPRRRWADYRASAGNVVTLLFLCCFPGLRFASPHLLAATSPAAASRTDDSVPKRSYSGKNGLCAERWTDKNSIRNLERDILNSANESDSSARNEVPWI